ncbi:hypothetical protein BHAOGJBA_2966 [Methylobacterium hispanicum]|uniref:Uncharacterized protein n=1 Tax=Methylobacterium hispanicum TaxID=270350 RepID=A0AAV4ZMW0_9HYPH|nr:hypothetical protein [Methylobacterium hispanicum]GJD89439.1 hypothetical protein BHAOGJBA_2966 [Methylobacterium hispanicum]
MSRTALDQTARRPAKGDGRFRTIEDIETAGERAVENILRAVGAYDVAQSTLDRCAARAAACGFPDPDFVLGRHKDWYSELEAIRTAGGGGPYHSRIVEARRDPDGAFLRWFEDHVRPDDYYLVRIVPGTARLEAAGLFGDAMHANLFHEIVWPREIALARVMRLGRQKQKAALAQIFLAQAREQPAMAYVGLARLHRQRDGIEIDEIVESGGGPDVVTASAFEAMEEGPSGIEIDFDNLLQVDPLWLRWILSEEGDIAGELNRLPKADFNDLVRSAREEAAIEQKEELRRRYAAQLRDPETRRGPWLDVSFVSRARTLGYTPNQYVAAVDRLVGHRIGRDGALDARVSTDDPGSLLVSWLEAHASDRPEAEALGGRGMAFARIDVDGVNPRWMEDRLPDSWRLFDHARWSRMTRWRQSISDNRREVPSDLAVDYAFFLLDDVRRHPVPDDAVESDEDDLPFLD